MKKQNLQRAELARVSDALEGLEDLFTQRQCSERPGVWAEPQLYLLPFCVPQDKATERFRSIKISETIQVNDQEKHRSFMVVPHPELGLPGSFDLEVMTGIYKLADTSVKETGSVPEFLELSSLRSFLESIGRSGAGVYTRMLKESLRRLAGTTCISEGFFYSKPRNLFIVESFTFITSVEIAGETDFNGNTYERTRVKLHEYIRDNLNSNFRTLIDFDYLRALRTDIAKPLALHLAYRFFKSGKSEWVADYDWLVERLALKPQLDFKRAKEQFKPALIELKRTAFLEDWEWLPDRKVRLLAGNYLLQLHSQRVKAKDAWLSHQAEKDRQEQLIIAKPPRTAKEAKRQEVFDPLAAICAEFAVRGWPAIAHKATSRGLTEEELRAEAVKRGHAFQQKLPT